MLVANYPNASHASPSFLISESFVTKLLPPKNGLAHLAKTIRKDGEAWLALGELVGKTVFRGEEFCDEAFAKPGTVVLLLRHIHGCSDDFLLPHWHASSTSSCPSREQTSP